MRHIQFCITSFERPEGLDNLLRSIEQYYPFSSVSIADQGGLQEIRRYNLNIKKIDLDYNCGLSASRNALIEEARKKYILLLEDDFVFNNTTQVELLQEILEDKSDIGIVGGLVKEKGYPFHFEHNLEIDKDTLWHTPDGDLWEEQGEIRFKRVDCVANFFLAKAEALKKVRWDKKLKLAEHTDFFLRFKDSGYKVAFTENVVIDTEKTNSRVYRDFKSENHEKCIKIMMRKHKLKKIIYLNGRVLELSGPEVKKYRVNYADYKRKNR